MSGRRRVPRHLREIERVVVAQGWALTETNSGHFKFYPVAGGEPIFCSKTPSEYRATRNLVAKLRSAGLDIPKSLRN